MIESCLVCGNSDQTDQMTVTDHLVSKDDFTLVKCPKCQFRYISDPPSAAGAYRFYDTEEYVEHSDNAEGIVNRVYHYARQWMLKYKYRLLESHGAKRKLLDFGTGTGYFIQAMKSKGYDVRGIEISEKARSFGIKNFALQLFAPDRLYDKDFEGGYGYITFWHVLEHVYEPHMVLQRLKELMADDGVMIVALPNYKCLEAKYYKGYWNGYDVPRHLWHFTKDSFISYMNGQGFKLIKTSRLPLDPYYNCLISESYRNKSWFYLFIPLLATISLIRGYFDIDKASSIVYHYKKSEG
jgi:2-polyprenyl-3-methyl-5-hydroxy-6-metoxy-1,4-benzoquinol methylase